MKKLIDIVLAGWDEADKRALSLILQRKNPVSLWFKERWTWIKSKIT